MARRNWDLNRKLTGWASLLCFVGWGICESLGYGDEIFAAGLIRNGLFLGALWFALTNKQSSCCVGGYLLVVGHVGHSGGDGICCGTLQMDGHSAGSGCGFRDLLSAPSGQTLRRGLCFPFERIKPNTIRQKANV